MAGYNKVILVGNLVRDPELRYTPQGTAVSDLSLAVSTGRGGRGPDRKEETMFIDVTVWDRQAENCCKYLSKGRSVLIDGRLQQDTWEDRESGKKRSKIKAVAQVVQFLGGRGEGGGGGGGGMQQQQSPAAAAPKPEEASLDEGFQGEDDIPF